jgi:hypothetical protein
MIETDRKLLTEYLGECWHEWQYIKGSIRQELFQCCKCGEACKGVASEEQKQRTFTTREDLYDLFGKIYEAGRWEEFEAYAWDRWPDVGSFKHGIGKYTAWLFCLSGDGYEERCQMMTDWIKEANHE